MSFEAMTWAVKVLEQHPDLESGPRFVLLIMANRADEDGELFPSVRWIMQRTALSERSVRAYIKEILGRGLMKKEGRVREDGGQSSNTYRLAMSQYILQLVPPGAPHAGGGAPNAPGGARRAGEGVHDVQGVGAPGAPLETKERDKRKESLRPLAADVFDLAIKAYPKRIGNDPLAKAVKAWNARIREGADPALVLAGVQRYAAFCATTGKVNTEKVMMRATFFGPDKPFEQEFGLAQAGAAPAAVLNGSWWKTSEGVKGKGAELGIEIPADITIPGWYYGYQCRVFAAAGPGPWMDTLSESARREVLAIRAKTEPVAA